MSSESQTIVQADVAKIETADISTSYTDRKEIACNARSLCLKLKESFGIEYFEGTIAVIEELEEWLNSQNE